ncbi:hypothetical protein SKAU_G00278790 [Synaphobranchus kaupii]|uniref:Uncharacterized protein n=1 Tax=Synaphobranchus kaupii TaxID=118154 RepID=A0A9Q1INT5_SYNKA|nr:hypothetical protein SKAU_G00278790 [Synaphobranchus kaupii]
MESSGEVDTETELINIKAELRTMEGEIHKLLERQMWLNTRMAMLEVAGVGATRMVGAAIHSGPNAGSDVDEPQGRSSAGKRPLLLFAMLNHAPFLNSWVYGLVLGLRPALRAMSTRVHH